MMMCESTRECGMSENNRGNAKVSPFTYSQTRPVRLLMFSGMVPVSWLPPRDLQQWVGGEASQGPNDDVREHERVRGARRICGEEGHHRHYSTRE